MPDFEICQAFDKIKKKLIVFFLDYLGNFEYPNLNYQGLGIPRIFELGYLMKLFRISTC